MESKSRPNFTLFHALVILFAPDLGPTSDLLLTGSGKKIKNVQQRDIRHILFFWVAMYNFYFLTYFSLIRSLCM